MVRFASVLVAVVVALSGACFVEDPAVTAPGDTAVSDVGDVLTDEELTAVEELCAEARRSERVASAVDSPMSCAGSACHGAERSGSLPRFETVPRRP